MSELCIEVGLPGELCTKIGHLGDLIDRLGNLASHPYNQDNPELSTWWLFPKVKSIGENWPAYEYGKYVFDKPAGTGAIRAGLHVEKGLGPEFAALATGANRERYRMGPSWLWHEFVESLDGEVKLACEQIAAAILPGRLQIEVSTGATPFEKGDRSPKASRWSYEYQVATRTLTVMGSPRDEKLPSLDGPLDWSSLKLALADATKSAPGLWLDLVIAVAFRSGVTATQPGDVLWEPAEIWDQVLEPLAPWIRRGVGARP